MQHFLNSLILSVYSAVTCDVLCQISFRVAAVFYSELRSPNFQLRTKLEAVSEFRGCILWRLHLKTDCITAVRQDCSISQAPSNAANKCVHPTPEKPRLQQVGPSQYNLSQGSLLPIYLLFKLCCVILFFNFHHVSSNCNWNHIRWWCQSAMTQPSTKARFLWNDFY